MSENSQPEARVRSALFAPVQIAEAFPKLLENVGCTANFPQAASLDAALTDG